jgi:hypothetical protein
MEAFGSGKIYVTDNVRLKVRNGKFYAQVSWEEKTVQPVITKAYYGYRHQRLSLSFGFSLCPNGREFRKV